VADVFAWIVGLLLGAFTLRRALCWIASLLPWRACSEDRSRSVSVLVAARNEAAGLPRLLTALERIDYPAELLNVVLVSDGSTDQTSEIMSRWAEAGLNRKATLLQKNRGKAAALQVALEAAPRAELIIVLDADAVPEPPAIARIVGAFRDPRVGAACGYPDPGKNHASTAAKYAALERWVSHLVTFAAKDRLNSQPPVIGAFCCIRAEALQGIGGFPQGTMVEDIHVSLALSRAGWKTRWIGSAVAREDVPADLNGFRLQRLRWSRGMMAIGHKARGIEELFVVAGYLDRLVLVAALALTLLGLLPWWLLATSVAVPAVIILTALAKAGMLGHPAYLWSIVPMTLADLGVTAEAALAQIARRPLRWAQR